jgi:hypothetical protein
MSPYSARRNRLRCRLPNTGTELVIFVTPNSNYKICTWYYDMSKICAVCSWHKRVDILVISEPVGWIDDKRK